FYRAKHEGFKLIDQCPGVAADVFMAKIREIDLPVDPFRGLGSLVVTKLNRKRAAGRQIPDSRKAGDRAWHGKEGEQVVNAARVGACLNQSRSEQGFDFRSKEQPFAARR